jgi:hypothetical protein
MEIDELNLDENAVVVVCVRATDFSPYADNLHGECALCHVSVQHRPHVPQPCTLICKECFLARVEDGETIYATPRTLAEVQAYFHRN